MSELRCRAGSGGAHAGARRYARAPSTWMFTVSALALAAPPPAAGQVSPGVHAGWGSGSEFSLGARLAVGLDGLVRGLETSGIFDYYFPAEGAAANVADWELSVNLVYRIPTEALALTPYGGAGVDVARFSASVSALGTDLQGSETRTGLNLLGGLLFEVGRTRPFLEARMTTGGSDQFALSAGLRL